MESAWHILRIGAGLEGQVASSLAHYGHEVYNPTRIIKVFNRKMRAWRKRVMPLFPGYLFVKTNNPRNIAPAALIGARSFMRNTDRSYSKMNDMEYNEVVSLERAMNDPENHALNHPYKKGQAVRVKGDAFLNLDCIIRKLSGDELVVETEMFGRVTKVTVPSSGVVAT